MNWGAFDLNLLIVFDAVMRERNVTKAGQRIGLSQPAVSHALSRLRYMLKDELFVRTPGGMTPTPRAEQLALPLRNALTGLQLALEPEAFVAAESERRFALAVNNYAAVVLAPRGRRRGRGGAARSARPAAKRDARRQGAARSRGPRAGDRQLRRPRRAVRAPRPARRPVRGGAAARPSGDGRAPQSAAFRRGVRGAAASRHLVERRRYGLHRPLAWRKRLGAADCPSRALSRGGDDPFAVGHGCDAETPRRRGIRQRQRPRVSESCFAIRRSSARRCFGTAVSTASRATAGYAS
jgi:hypothetical protein